MLCREITNDFNIFLKKNNIDKSERYINSMDIEKYLKETILVNIIEEIEDLGEHENSIEDIIYNYVTNINYQRALEIEDTNYLIELICECEFDIYIDKNENGKYVLKLEDYQFANLSGIEEEEFETINDICTRMEDSYFYDYFHIGYYKD